MNSGCVAARQMLFFFHLTFWLFSMQLAFLSFRAPWLAARGHNWDNVVWGGARFLCDGIRLWPLKFVWVLNSHFAATFSQIIFFVLVASGEAVTFFCALIHYHTFKNNKTVRAQTLDSCDCCYGNNMQRKPFLFELETCKIDCPHVLL